MRSPGDATPAFVFVPELAGPGQRLTLTGDDAHYVTRVCRARPGDTVRASNGRGLVARLRLDSLAPLTADVVELEPHDPSGGGWVMTGAPEGQRADWMVEKLAELGITRWQPLSCARSPWPSAPARLERWERLATAALRQSRAAWRMEVASPIEVADAIASLPEGGRRWLADPDGEPLPSARSVTTGLTEPPQVVAIGPAEGFDDRERERLRAAGFRPACLATRRLRTETAALAWAAWDALEVVSRTRGG